MIHLIFAGNLTTSQTIQIDRRQSLERRCNRWRGGSIRESGGRGVRDDGNGKIHGDTSLVNWAA